MPRTRYSPPVLTSCEVRSPTSGRGRGCDGSGTRGGERHRRRDMPNGARFCRAHGDPKAALHATAATSRRVKDPAGVSGGCFLLCATVPANTLQSPFACVPTSLLGRRLIMNRVLMLWL